jgi:hypothetical protein
LAGWFAKDPSQLQQSDKSRGVGEIILRVESVGILVSTNLQKMKIDSTPIINKIKLDLHVLDEEVSEDRTNNLDTSSCTCSNKCTLIEKIPPNEGIMITMHDLNANNRPQSTNGNGKINDGCTCLKIQPQVDGNLASVHPNIYIPSSLLDYPDQIVKYGGGGSGVTGECGLFLFRSILLAHSLIIVHL